MASLHKQTVHGIEYWFEFWRDDQGKQHKRSMGRVDATAPVTNTVTNKVLPIIGHPVTNKPDPISALIAGISAKHAVSVDLSAPMPHVVSTQAPKTLGQVRAELRAQQVKPTSDNGYWPDE
jgi:hypothetical protein